MSTCRAVCECECECEYECVCKCVSVRVSAGWVQGALLKITKQPSSNFEKYLKFIYFASARHANIKNKLEKIFKNVEVQTGREERGEGTAERRPQINSVATHLAMLSREKYFLFDFRIWNLYLSMVKWLQVCRLSSCCHSSSFFFSVEFLWFMRSQKINTLGGGKSGKLGKRARRFEVLWAGKMMW